MTSKTITFVCAQVLLIQTALSQYVGVGLNNGPLINNLGIAEGYNGISAAQANAIAEANSLGLAQAQLANGGLALANANANLAGYGPGLNNAGPFVVTSSSPIGPIGLSVVADNLVIDGALAVSGNMPFQGAVAVDGTLPAVGQGAVLYSSHGGAGLNENINGLGGNTLAAEIAGAAAATSAAAGMNAGLTNLAIDRKVYNSLGGIPNAAALGRVANGLY